MIAVIRAITRMQGLSVQSVQDSQLLRLFVRLNNHSRRGSVRLLAHNEHKVANLYTVVKPVKQAHRIAENLHKILIFAGQNMELYPVW